MKKSTFKITIPEPCHENWDKMTPEAKGRFCQKCAKTVHDFSNKSNRQIAKTYKENDGKVCGRFRESQLNNSIPTYQPGEPTNRWTTAGMVLSGLLTFGEITAQNNPPIKGKVAITRVVEEPTIVGEMMPIATHTITGKVTNQEGQPIPYATIKGKTIDVYTQADSEGNFSIEIPSNNYESELVFEFWAMDYFSKIAIVHLDQQPTKEIHVQLMEETFVIPDEGMILGLVLPIEEEEPSFFDKVKTIFRHKTEELIEQEEDLDPTPSVTPPPIQIIQKIYPNPFVDYLKIAVHTLQNETLEFVLYNENGRSLYQQKNEIAVGNTTIEMDMNHLILTDGIYFLSVFRNGEIVKTEMVVRVGQVRP